MTRRYASEDFPAIYWSSRDGGTAEFGFRFFSKNIGPEWDGFEEKFLPAQSLTLKPTSVHYFYNTIKSLPDQNSWIQNIQLALQCIREKQFEKVVLARRVTLDCTSPIDPLSLCQAILEPNQTTFLIQLSPTVAFLGSTPETLYRRKKRHIECDALAGTRPRSTGLELLQSKKDLNEFYIVKNRIIDLLAPLCKSTPIASPNSLRTTSTLCHLYSKIEGELKDFITDEMILDALHPTPAVGGWPRDAALSFLAQHEPFSRGLYAAPIGWKTEEEAEFVVAIRSCLIQGSRIHLFAGTGIVEGSSPSNEWEESEHKLSRIQSLFSLEPLAKPLGIWAGI